MNYPTKSQTSYTHKYGSFFSSLSSAGHPKDFYFCFYSTKMT